jgi:hypothetical protein
MDNPHIIWMYAKIKHAETLQEIERYRLVRQAQARRRANRRNAGSLLRSLAQSVQSIVSCVQTAPQGEKSVCLA